MSQVEKDAFDSVEDDFVHLCIDYAARLAAAIFMEQDGVNSVEFLTSREKKPWKAKFFGTDVNVRLLWESSLLVGNKNVFKFSHRSIMEYFFTCLLFELVNGTGQSFVTGQSLKNKIMTSQTKGTNWLVKDVIKFWLTWPKKESVINSVIFF